MEDSMHYILIDKGGDIIESDVIDDENKYIKIYKLNKSLETFEESLKKCLNGAKNLSRKIRKKLENDNLELKIQNLKIEIDKLEKVKEEKENLLSKLLYDQKENKHVRDVTYEEADRLAASFDLFKFGPINRHPRRATREDKEEALHIWMGFGQVTRWDFLSLKKVKEKILKAQEILSHYKGRTISDNDISTYLRFYKCVEKSGSSAVYSFSSFINGFVI